MIMISITDFLIFTATFLLVVFILRARNNKRNDNHRHPPSFPCLPIVGSLPFIRDLDDFPGFLMKKSTELGPVFTLKFGSRVVAVLNNLVAIEDAFVKHGFSFSGRESFYTEKYVLNRRQKGISSHEYNDQFKRYRKLVMSIMKEFGFGHRGKMETLIETEIIQLIDHIKKTEGKAFDPAEMTTLSVSNVPLSMIFGKRRRFDEGLADLFVKIRKYVETINPALDFFPILRFVPPHSRTLEEFKHHGGRMLELVEEEIQEILQNKAVDCFVNRYIEREGQEYDHEQLLFTIRDLITGSLETTSTLLLWSFIFLANNPHVAERVQKEIDAVVPRDRLPSSNDRELLPYTEATILELLRHRTPVPLGVPHLTIYDTEVLGYFIPANTVVISNLSSANMNPVDWPDAEVFKPERFLDNENKLINKDRVISFSLGRRACPGEALARHQLFLFISGLLQNFSFLPPEGTESINNEIIRGTTDVPHPFTIRMIHRQR